MTRRRSLIKSHPLIQSSLSETQRDFMCFVQRQAGGRDALYQADLDSDLPGDTVRVRMTTTDVAADVSEHIHTVEFMSLTGDGRWEWVGWIGHSLKELEAMHGRPVETESSFEIGGAGVRDGELANGEVERAVQVQLQKLKAARLLPLATSRALGDRAPRQLTCAA
jgi:hypothetical protein